MNRYDPAQRCAACGADPSLITTRYDPAGVGAARWRRHSVIARHCGRCGRTWEELPLDEEQA